MYNKLSITLRIILNNGAIIFLHSFRFMLNIRNVLNILSMLNKQDA